MKPISKINLLIVIICSVSLNIGCATTHNVNIHKKTTDENVEVVYQDGDGDILVGMTGDLIRRVLVIGALLAVIPYLDKGFGTDKGKNSNEK